MCRLSECQKSMCPICLVQFNVGNPNPCDQSLVITNTFIGTETGCIDIVVYCQHPSFTLYEVVVNGSGQNVTAHGNYDVLLCQSSPTPGFYSAFTNNNPFVSQIYCSNRKSHHRCSSRKKFFFKTRFTSSGNDACQF
jgi:hypothetical protein